MCGVVGLARLGGGALPPDLSAAVEQMARSLSYRGPNSSGFVALAGGGIRLGHRRLAVVDLSTTGHQPMSSKSGRWTVSYNGEIYNAEALRRRLSVQVGQWSGHSDTEVLLEALDAWGVERTLDSLDAMFAFAAHDARERVLWLCRDRFGEKPILYTRIGDILAFASELKGLRSVPGISTTLSERGLQDVLEFGHTCGEGTILENVYRVPPGSRLRVDLDSGDMALQRYWDPVAEAAAARARPKTALSLVEADELLAGSVRSRMVSDVPLGAFLSGGVDSSLVVAAMSRTSTRSPRTFTIGFPEAMYDETSYARQVAAHLGSEHTEFSVSHREALELVPSLSSISDEPFADASLLPTFIVSRLARRHVTVALSGDGGDELFGGYDRYRMLDRFLRWESRINPAIRGRVGAVLSRGDFRLVDALLDGPMRRLAPRSLRRRSASRANKFGRLLVGEPREAYRRLMAQNLQASRLVIGSCDATTSPYDLDRLQGDWTAVDRAMLLDVATYLPDDLLTKVDRASMAVSLEVRTPFLNPELFRFAWSLPNEQRLGPSEGKIILRQLLRTYLPDELVDRPKMGFGVPLEPWLRGPLAPWADDVLSRESLQTTGVFAVDEVGRMWDAHRSGRSDTSQQLWPLLMMQDWMTKWGVTR